jgi:GTP-binding protein
MAAAAAELEVIRMFRAAIVGRPNVGKSTLFNRLLGFRRTIVGDEPGITRDRIYGTVHWCGKTFELTDTGGLLPNVKEFLPARILEQVEAAIRESDLLILVVDGRAGSTALDEQLLPILRRTGLPIWVAVNKIDAPGLAPHSGQFFEYGTEAVFSISAEHNIGIGELLDAVAERVVMQEPESPQASEEEIKVAVVGRPNVGKSSLVNRLLGVERAIVSEIPGTTRDAVDTRIVRDGVSFRVIDTAGIRRKGRTEERTEKISVVVARKNLEKSDVALLLLDAAEGVTKLDAAIGGYAEESGCSVILVLNKWDLVEKNTHTVEEFATSVHRRMKYLQYAPILTASALTGQRVSKLYEMICKAHDARKLRAPTALLNHMFVPDLAAELKMHNPARKLEIKYITQAETEPPTFVIFTSGKHPLHFSTVRFIQNRLRERFGFYATPIRIQQRLKGPRRRQQ